MLFPWDMTRTQSAKAAYNAHLVEAHDFDEDTAQGGAALLCDDCFQHWNRWINVLIDSKDTAFRTAELVQARRLIVTVNASVT
jgi:hypothetical protein